MVQVRLHDSEEGVKTEVWNQKPSVWLGRVRIGMKIFFVYLSRIKINAFCRWLSWSACRHAALVAGLSACWVMLSGTGGVLGQEPVSATDQAKALSRAFRSAANSITPAVVTVISEVEGKDAEEISAEDFPFDLPPDLHLPEGFRLPASRNVGSGILIDESGIVLTNAHVIHGADRIWIRFSDGSELEAKNIKADSNSDLAIVYIASKSSLKAARLGDSDRLAIGDWVIAVGSPFEYESTVSAGIISGRGRGVAAIRRGKMLQTDAAINPGNSGGPLVNLDGEVVGINTAIVSVSGGYQGIGFAIPINRAKWVADQLIETGEVQRAYLGIRIGSVDAEYIRENDLKVPANYGILVEGVISDSPAADAGLQRGDVIVDFAGKSLRDVGDLQDAVEQLPLGSRHSVGLFREEKALSVMVELRPLPVGAVPRIPGSPAPKTKSEEGS
ncbi:MAG: serine protease [Planctomycetaceae bacterium]|nr:serine protease [Planctomycetaceae bacterium]